MIYDLVELDVVGEAGVVARELSIERRRFETEKPSVASRIATECERFLKR
jgi:hypothetical protein